MKEQELDYDDIVIEEATEAVKNNLDAGCYVEHLLSIIYGLKGENKLLKIANEVAKTKNNELFEERENMQAEIIASEEARLKAKKDTAKEILQKVKSYTLDNEVGMKYLIQRLGKEYGVEVK